MKKLSLLSIALLIVVTNIFAQVIKDQNGNPIPEEKLITTESGLKYIITQQGQGEKAKVGDKVVVHYNGRLLNDTVFDSSVKRGQPFTFALGQGQVIKGWDEAFQILGKGDKAVIILPPHIAYGAQSTGKIPANSTLIFDVELINIERQIQIEQFDTKGKDTLKTSSGLKYIIIEKGNGTKATAGSKIKVHYTGFFDDGKIFDSSVKRGEPIEFQLGKGQVIKGWDEGLQLMNVGDKFKLLIPYQLAYGDAGRSGAIPPKSNLTFDVELVEVK